MEGTQIKHGWEKSFNRRERKERGEQKRQMEPSAPETR
jgi:hypothetical protein